MSNETLQDMPERQLKQGLVQVFTGEGKGKTSAALGTVLRAVGHGLRIYISFFMKANHPSGEFSVLSRLPGVTAVRSGTSGFTDPKNIKPEEREEAKKALAAAREAMLSGKYDLVVLDEINVAAAWQLIALEEVVRLIRGKPRNVELILTGRHADKEIIQLADLVTEMLNIKHPFEKGIAARKGIEF
jgi:cob(I)alamin adenosyltransferase